MASHLLASHLLFRGRTLSRRRFMSGVAMAAASASTVALVSTAACAQASEWQEYRDDGIGFRFELPGKFKFDLIAPLDDMVVVRVAHLEAEFDQMVVLVNARELRDPPPIDNIYELLRAGAPMTGNLPSREEERSVSGVPARDFIREADKVNYINRFVIVDNRFILLSVFGLYYVEGHLVPGDRSIHGNPTVLRILDSLALLRGPEVD